MTNTCFKFEAVGHCSMAETSVAVDSMIKEYLVFRGFSLTLKSFEAELKGDKNKQFKVSFFCLKRSIRFLNSKLSTQCMPWRGHHLHWNYTSVSHFLVDQPHVDLMQLKKCFFKIFNILTNKQKYNLSYFFLAYWLSEGCTGEWCAAHCYPLATPLFNHPFSISSMLAILMSSLCRDFKLLLWCIRGSTKIISTNHAYSNPVYTSYISIRFHFNLF